MQSLLKCMLLVLSVAATLAVPVAQPGLRQRRYASPTRAMMFSGYFRGHNPQRSFNHYVPRNYEPEGAMTAFAAGNTVSAGSYYGNGGQQPAECGQCNGNGNPGTAEDTTGSPPEVIFTPNEEQPQYPEEPITPNADEAPATEAPVEEQDVPEGVPQDSAHPGNGNGNGQGHSNGNGHGHSNGNGHPNGNGHSNGNGNGQSNGNGHSNGNGNGHSNGDGHSNGNGHPNGKGNGNGNGGRAPTRPRSDEEDPEDDEDDSPPGFFPPGKKGRGRGTFYNSYFPMIFGSYPGYGGRNGNGGGGEGTYNPGVATAIANSFSTGRGAVATSHATAYGGPHVLGNGSRKGSSRRSSSPSPSSNS